MTAPSLVDRLRALALHQDLAECAEAADRIEALEREAALGPQIFNPDVPVRRVHGALVNVGDWCVLLRGVDPLTNEVFERVVAFPFASQAGRPDVYIERVIGRPL